MPKKKIEFANECFVNPYTFIPLEEKPNREKYRAKKGLSGWIECNIKTKTPLFIPNITNDKVFDKPNDEIPSYDFFSYKDLSKGKVVREVPEPIIPGSEIRGMIRHAFEALTNSCMSAIDENKPFYKRTTYIGQAGRLVKKNSKWYIQRCIRYRLPKYLLRKNSELNEEGKKIYFKATRKKKVIKYDFCAKPGFKTGFIHIGEDFGRKKKNESVFEEVQEFFSIPKEALSNLIENVELYEDETVNIALENGHKGYRHLKWGDIKNLDKALIYYHEIKDSRTGKKFYYLSPAAITREIFYNKMGDIIGEYIPCKTKESLCPSCKIFGFIGEKTALKSKVRFTDAKLSTNGQKEEELFFESVILPELSSPKPSATEFYLKKPTDDEYSMWNYDYAIKYKFKNRKLGDPEEIKNYQPEIRGRKFYWHNLKVKTPPKIDEDSSKSKRNVQVRALKPNISFSFKIYFEDLEEIELKRLLWVLEVGGKQKHGHKLGRGKPLGMGSVKISVQKVWTRKVEVKDHLINYKIEENRKFLENSRTEENIQAMLGCGEKTIEAFLKVTRFDTIKKEISYPVIVGSKRHYEWFVCNRTKRPATGTRHSITQTLPHITESGSQALKKYKKIRK